MRPIVTLLTDFGYSDPYVAEMKGVILGICSEAVLVDISHEIEKFNTAMGAIILASSFKFFPRGSIHLAVVDPGVGGSRRAIIVECDHGFLVGPDNGLLALAAEHSDVKGVYQIKPGLYTQRNISPTFHGRDIFAPVAAYIARGVPAYRLGSRVEKYVKQSHVKPIIGEDFIECVVLYVDSFGNVITNVSDRDSDEMELSSISRFDVKVKDRIFEARRASTYSEAEENSLLVIPDGSRGFMELAVNKGSASQLLAVKAGSRLYLRIR